MMMGTYDFFLLKMAKKMNAKKWKEVQFWRRLLCLSPNEFYMSGFRILCIFQKYRWHWVILSRWVGFQINQSQVHARKFKIVKSYSTLQNPALWLAGLFTLRCDDPSDPPLTHSNGSVCETWYIPCWFEPWVNWSGKVIKILLLLEREREEMESRWIRFK